MSNSSRRNFAGGEISPSLWARTDLVRYGTGARIVRNFLVRPEGSLDNRGGTEFAGLLPGAATLRPFVFNRDQSYVLEFTDLLLRFAREGAYIGAPYSIVTPYIEADLAGLQITQNADVVTIVHPGYPVYELRRLAETNWTLTAVTFGPAIAAPTNLFLNPAAVVGASFRNWVVTALSDTGEESVPSNVVAINSVVIPQARDLFWDVVSGAVGYNIYVKYFTGSYGFIGTSVNASFSDPGITPDFLNQPPAPRAVFAAPGDYPAACGQYQQRTLFGGATNTPETIFTSRSANRSNFGVSVPTQDDDAITFSLIGTQVNAVRHLVDFDTDERSSLLVFTSGAEYRIGGDNAGILRPTDIGPRRMSTHGASTLPPIVTNDRVLFVQDRQTRVRELLPSKADLTLFARHFFEGHTLIDWAAQESSNIVWAVRDDGVLVGVTTLADEDVLGWHRHDTDGLYENVCVIPEDGEDRVYLVVNRDGARMLERMRSRTVPEDIIDSVFMDAALSYDGRNVTPSHTMRLSGGTTWAFDELLTCTLVGSTFSASSVGNAVDFTDAAGETLRFIISAYVSATVVQGFATRTVPTELQNVPIGTWTYAVDAVGGLSHLEGKAVSVFADAYVVANPNNPEITFTVTVSGGVATLDQPYGVIHVGLPYVSDLYTLDLDSAAGPSLRDKKMLINTVTLEVNAARGIFAGTAEPPSDDSLDGLYEFKIRDTDTFAQPAELLSGVARLNLQGAWNPETNGRVFIRQTDPLPLSILAVIPTGVFPSGA